MRDDALQNQYSAAMSIFVVVKYSFEVEVWLNRYLLSFERNEKRRIEGTGEAATWQYYHEVDELLGAHNEHSLDMSNLDESNINNSTSISKLALFLMNFYVLSVIFAILSLRQTIRLLSYL